MAKIKTLLPFPVLTFIFFGFLFFHFGRIMLTIKDDKWVVGHINLYGDLLLHLGFINKFIQSSELVNSSPFFPSDKPNYPIFADFITAQVAKVLGLETSLFITTFIVGLLIIYVSRNFILNILKNEKIVFLALLLFFFNGGLGFTYFYEDFLKSNSSFLQFITNLPREYTNIKEQGYWWINSLLAYFLPQRGFMFAFPITLTVLSLIYIGYQKNKTHLFILAGLIAGVLPLVQFHSLFLLFLLSTFYFLISLFKSNFSKKVIIHWLLFAIITLIVAVPVAGSISSIENPFRFFKIDPGWMSEENLIIFWFKNLGLFGPVLILSLFWLYKKIHLFVLYLPFLIIFIISNVFVFQPWNFDNSKLLIYWYFASTIVVAYFIYDKFLSENLFKKLFGIIMVIVMIFSGTIDIFRTFTPATEHQIFSKSDITVTEAVKYLTDKNTLFLTASNHNHPIPALTGRSTLVGFHGWIWSHGLPYEQRAADINKVYSGHQEAEQLISKYEINYITVGPQERTEFRINENFLNNFPAISLTPQWVIYDVSSIWADSNR